MTPGSFLELLLLYVAAGGCVGTGSYIVLPANLKPSPYPEWAHYHWVWLSNDRANQSSMMAYTQEYLDHGVKVGAVDIDSGWSTGFNNFEFDSKKYPNASKMVEFFHSKNIRVILWATSMIDTDSSNYQDAYDNEYFIKDIFGKQALFSWWHGKGGLLDYTNEEAKQWWHGQMDKALSLDIDGWKCDGTDPYILELVFPIGKEGLVTRREYSDAYYGDFFDYTREKLGEDRLIMSRPADGFGPIFLDYSPKKVMLSGWVGDNDPTFQGMENALKSYLQSAWAGYANFGSDIGGYRSGSGELGRTKELFIRWAQLGAFSPLMENGGNKEHRPWMFDTTNQTLDIYNKFVDVHYKLIPYLLTTGSEALENNKSSIVPLAKHDNFIDKLIDDFKPFTYNYLLGADILVAPIYTNSSSTVSVTFPTGSKWVYWWNHSRVYEGGSKHTFSDVPLEEYPVFFKNGTFIPLRVTDHTPIYGQSGFAGYLKWLLHSPVETSMPVKCPVREQEGAGIMAAYWWTEPKCLRVDITAHPDLHSLIEISGLKTAAKVVAVQTVHGTFINITRAFSSSELNDSSGAYQMQYNGGYYKVFINPGTNVERGHSIKVYMM